MNKLYKEREVLVRNCSFGVAFEAMKQGHRITRETWGGWWQLELLPELGETIVAYLKDGKSKVPAQPYQQDMMATDWIILSDPIPDEVIDVEDAKDDYGLTFFQLSVQGEKIINKIKEKFEWQIIHSYTRVQLEVERDKAINYVESKGSLFHPLETQLIIAMINKLITEAERQL